MKPISKVAINGFFLVLFTWNLYADSAPTIDSIPTVYVNPGSIDVDLSVYVSHTGPQTLIFGLCDSGTAGCAGFQDPPAWLSINGTNGHLQGSPSAADIGDYSLLMYSCHDDFSECAGSNVFTLSVINGSPNQAPVRLGIPELSFDLTDVVALDLDDYFADPDGDPLTYEVEVGYPLPPGLTLDGNTGEISGQLSSLDGAPWTVAVIVTDPNGGWEWDVMHIWVPLSHGPFTSLFFRPNCNQAIFDCIPGYDYPNGSFVDEQRPNGNLSTSAYIDEEPDPDVLRAAASVGYKGAELTPAISAYLRPDASERHTGSHWGLARYNPSGSTDVVARLSWSQSGGVLTPINPQVGDDLSYGAMTQATLFSYELLSTAQGKLDPALCPPEYTDFLFADYRTVLVCILDGVHPHVVNLQKAAFDLDIPLDDSLPAPLKANETKEARLSLIPSSDSSVGNGIFVGVEMFQIARYEGVVDSQHTMDVSFTSPESVEPDMDNIEAPSFEPAPTPAGQVDILADECVLIKNNGTIPVAIFGGDGFDAHDVITDSMTFGGLQLAILDNGIIKKPKRNQNHHKITSACFWDDLNDDGEDDLLCHFSKDKSLWTGETGLMALGWEMAGSAELYSGSDFICVVD